jgi:Zn-dependent protease
MRDPMTWSLPIGRLFGVTLKVHLLYPLVALGLILRSASQSGSAAAIDTAVMTFLLLVIIIFHEFGHVFGARWVDGDATEVLIWPLGGLASCDIPHTPRAHFITVAAGPLVNVVLCLLVALGLTAGSFSPLINPIQDPFNPHLHNLSDGLTYSRYGNGLFALDPNGPPRPVPSVDQVGTLPDGRVVLKANQTMEVHDTRLPLWAVLATQFYLLSAFLFFFNLIPAFPMDGGRLLQAVLWWRGDYRSATVTAVSVGFMGALAVFIVAMVVDTWLLAFLALFIYTTCRQQLIALETGGEESPFGYDFSQGYTSLERGEAAPAIKPRRPNFVQRWLQRRAARKLLREHERREHDELRMDQLLQKIAESGKASLTDEERRFLTRVSGRYRHKK